jgi:hypothetical protein
MFCISLRWAKLRSGCSMSFSIRRAKVWWELAVASTAPRIFSHGPWKTLKSADAR